MQLDLYQRTINSLNGQSDGGHDFVINGEKMDIKTSKNDPVYAFSRTNNNRDKSQLIGFTAIDYQHDGSVWLALKGWSKLSEVKPLMKQGPNFNDLNLQAVKERGLLYMPKILLSATHRETTR